MACIAPLGEAGLCYGPSKYPEWLPHYIWYIFVHSTDSPECKHCHTLAPVYSRAAKLLKDHVSEIKMAKVDATQERELTQRYNIGGYPTVKFFRNGTPIDYKIIQDHDENQIVAWLKQKTESSVKVITSPDQLKQLRHDFVVVVAGFFKAGFNSSGGKYA